MNAEQRAALTDAIGRTVDGVRHHFTQPADVRLTLIARTPWLADGGVVVSDDSYALAAEELARLAPETRVLRCAFCDEVYPPGTPPTQHEALTAHVTVCTKHPLRAEIERLTRENARAKERLASCTAELKVALEEGAGLRSTLALVRTPADGVWYWAGKDDNPESLSCPVVMTADAVRRFCACIAELERTNELRERVVTAALECCHAAEIEMLADELEVTAKDMGIATAPRAPSRVYSRLRLLIRATRELRDAQGGAT